MSDAPPLLFVFMIGVAGYFGWLWRSDLADGVAGRQNRQPLPGATPAPRRALVLAATGAVLIVLAETLGELALGVSEEQTRITVLFGAYTLAAALIEEIIFRGFLVIEHRGRRQLVLGAVGVSVIFAALHPFLWQWDDDGFRLTLTVKGAFSTSAVFVSSLWFYTVRFASWNPTRSLLPCIVAHAAKNLTVIAIKASQGFVGDWW